MGSGITKGEGMVETEIEREEEQRRRGCECAKTYTMNNERERERSEGRARKGEREIEKGRRKLENKELKEAESVCVCVVLRWEVIVCVLCLCSEIFMSVKCRPCLFVTSYPPLSPHPNSCFSFCLSHNFSLLSISSLFLCVCVIACQQLISSSLLIPFFLSLSLSL